MSIPFAPDVSCDVIHKTNETPDGVGVTLGQRFHVRISRTIDGIDIAVHPVSGGVVWDFPYETFFVTEAGIVELELDAMLTAR